MKKHILLLSSLLSFYQYSYAKHHYSKHKNPDSTHTSTADTANTSSSPEICAVVNATSSSMYRNAPPKKDDTDTIQKSLDSCKNSHKSVVLQVSGNNNAFYTNSLNVVGEHLVVNGGVKVYGSNEYAKNPQLIFITGDNAGLSGQGIIDGRGDILSPTKSRLVQVRNASNVKISDITLAQALHPHLYIEGVKGMTVTNIKIRSPATRKNADGIDIDSSDNVIVDHSSVEAGDDGIAIKTNSGPATNIRVENSEFYGTHGISIGSQTFNGVKNITFKNNFVYGFDLENHESSFNNGINIKSGPTCGGLVSNVLYQNTHLFRVKHLINLDTTYPQCAGKPGTPVFKNIIIDGVQAENSVPGAYTRIRGYDPLHPIEVFMSNVELDTDLENGTQFATVSMNRTCQIHSTGPGVKVLSSAVSQPQRP